MAKREPRWVKVFLRELERTGNVRMAASHAGVDFTTAYGRRKRHVEFAEWWALRLAAFRGGSGQAGALRSAQDERYPSPGAVSAAPPSPAGGRGSDPSTSCAGPPPSAGIPPAHLGRRSLEAGSAHSKLGEELVVRPDGQGGAALVRAGPNARWGKRAEERFLAALAETANVRRAAAAAGVSTVAVYARRLKHTDFAEAWEFALDTGKAKLETMLVEAAQRRFDPDALPVSENEPQVSVSEALNIVKLKRGEPGAGPAAGGRKPCVATPEEAAEGLIKRLKVFAARIEKEDLEKGWTKDGNHMIPPGWVRIEDARCAKCGGEVVKP